MSSFFHYIIEAQDVLRGGSKEALDVLRGGSKEAQGVLRGGSKEAHIIIGMQNWQTSSSLSLLFSKAAGLRVTIDEINISRLFAVCLSHIK